jgi:hypothetical protein
MNDVTQEQEIDLELQQENPLPQARVGNTASIFVLPLPIQDDPE